MCVCANSKDTKHLWELHQQTGNKSAQKQTVISFDPYQINGNFAGIATDPIYSRDQVIQAAQRAPNHPFSHVDYIKDRIERIMAKTNNTAPGNDSIPYRVFRDCSSELAGVNAGIVNMYVGKGVEDQLGEQLSSRLTRVHSY